MTAATTTNLTAFLLARLDEDQAAALAASNAPCVASASSLLGVLTITPPSIIARYDPARVLAEVASKRAIVAAYRQWDETEESYSPDYWAAPMSDVLYALASVYASHRDFDESWRA